MKMKIMYKTLMCRFQDELLSLTTTTTEALPSSSTRNLLELIPTAPAVPFIPTVQTTTREITTEADIPTVPTR